MGSIGWTEIAVILVLALLLFGGRKIPQLAKDLGSGIREFKDSLSGASSSNADAPPARQQISDSRDLDEPAPRPRAKKQAARRKRA